ncbi:MAG TPA: glycoside hydrolase family 38 C-terminal domain-containing protein [Acidimicrobiales bacterium]|nr:glycoside hydrolase family 38 C-terminal domain-containing protein [Acidimicrobiales bacterium]
MAADDGEGATTGATDPGGRRPGAGPRRRVHVVPHTHWDREWYASFQTFRLGLVDLLDDLLPRVEADPALHFLLDGQLAVVDDYLAARPGAEERLRRLVGSGRVAVGPWYTLPDEFLVGGETLVRNLQLGLRRGDRLGGAMPVGYLPDMFGHVAQMPQILAGFGFEHAVVWRGVPAAVGRSGFTWRSPDGSAVRAEYLPQSYANGALPSPDPAALTGAVEAFVDRWGDLLDGPVLWMSGADHQAPPPWLTRAVAEANDAQDRLDLRLSSLADHLATVPLGDLPEWRGELRSGARANLLMGVTSNRVDVRVASARAERALLQGAEPLSALHLPAERWPATLLDEAWHDVILDAAHDSVCACSSDVVCAAVLHRYGEAADIAEGLASRAVAHLADRIDHDGPVVVNPTAGARDGLVELTLPGREAPPGTQLVVATPAEVVLHRGPATAVLAAAGQVESVPGLTAFSLERADGTVLAGGRRHGPGPMVADDLGPVPAASDHEELVLRARQEARVTVLAAAGEVPGFGWRAWSPPTGPASAPVTVADGDGHGPRLANGLVTVEVDAADGTFAVDGRAGLGRLVDGGDVGDTYNWCPPAEDLVVDRPRSVEVRVLERGPLRARVLVVTRTVWPARREGLQRRVGAVPHDVRSTVELRAGERAVRVEVVVDNRSCDHRLRTHLRLPVPATTARAECAFGTVDRGPVAEGGPGEPALPTYPAQRFVQAGGLTVVHDGVTEHELVDLHDGAAHELALTLLRATGMLSQGPMPTRLLPAGPVVAAPGAQLQQRVTRRYAVAVGDVDPYALADAVLVPLHVGTARGGRRDPGRRSARPELPAVGSALAVEGAVVSSVVRQGDELLVRVVNPTSDEVTVRVPGRHGRLVDLRGRPGPPVAGAFRLRGHGIATVALQA